MKAVYMSCVLMLGISLFLACSGAVGQADDTCADATAKCFKSCGKESSENSRTQCRSWCGNQAFACLGKDIFEARTVTDDSLQAIGEENDDLRDVLSVLTSGEGVLDILKVTKKKPKLTEVQSSYIGPVGWKIMGAAVTTFTVLGLTSCYFRKNCFGRRVGDAGLARAAVEVAGDAVIGGEGGAVVERVLGEAAEAVARDTAYREMLRNAESLTGQMVTSIEGIPDNVFAEALAAVKNSEDFRGKNIAHLSAMQIEEFNQLLIDTVALALGLAGE